MSYGSANANVEDFEELQMDWCETLTTLDCLLDITRPSLVSLSIQKDEQKSRFYRVKIEELLPEHSIKFIKAGKLDKLSAIYHQLQANATEQKRAMNDCFILLSPWELLIFKMFNALAGPQSMTNVRQFYKDSEDEFDFRALDGV